MIALIKKKWKTIALVMIALGIILTAAGTAMGGAPVYSISYSKSDKWHISTGIQDSKTPIDRIRYEKTAVEAFDNLSIDVKSMDIYLESGEEYALEYVKDRTAGAGDLEIDSVSRSLTITEGSRFSVFSWDFSALGRTEKAPSYVKVYVPSDADVRDIKLAAGRGNIYVSDEISAQSLDIEVVHGTVQIGNTDIAALSIQAESGDIELGTLCADEVTLKTDHGNVNGARVEANSVNLKVVSGSVNIELFDAIRAEIKTEVGDIFLGMIESEDAYFFHLKTGLGTVKLNGTVSEEEIKSEVEEKAIQAAASSGSVEIVTR